MGSFNPSDTFRVLLVDPDEVPYALSGIFGMGAFNPSDTARVVLCDPNGVPYKATGGGGGGGANITSGQDSIAQGDTVHIITHNLADATAILMGAYGNWNSGQPYIVDQDANTITIAFPNECPLSSGGALDWSVEGGSSVTLTTGTNNIAQGDTSSIITHNLGSSATILVGATTNWNVGGVYITAQDANTITVTFANECPLSTGGALTWSVV